MKMKLFAVAAAATLGLSACGDTAGQQALTGGLIGGAAAAATSNSVGPGIVLGAATAVAFCQSNPHDPKC